MKTFYYSDGNTTQGLIEMFEEMGIKAEKANEVMGDCVKVTMTDEQFENFSKDVSGAITDTAEEHQKLYDECQ